MSNEPPEPGASEPESPADPPTQPLPAQTPPQLPPGYPPRPPHPPPYAQPVWQGHQAPQQASGWPGQPPLGQPQPRKNKGLLIGLLVVLALALVGAVVVGALLLADSSDSATSLNDISPGDCLVGSGLDEADEEVSDLETVDDCNDDHDAEVFATFELGADQDLDAAGSQCVEEAEAAGRTLDDLTAADLEIRPLVASDSPDEGDKVVCFIRHPDGSSLSGSEFE